jgi:hypothetical protein
MLPLTPVMYVAWKIYRPRPNFQNIIFTLPAKVLESYLLQLVRFQVLSLARMKMTAFWDVAPCSLEVDRRFRGAYCLHRHCAVSQMAVIFSGSLFY